MNINSLLDELVNTIVYDMSWGSTPLEEIFNIKEFVRSYEDHNNLKNIIKENLNEISLVQACKVLNIDYRELVNEFTGEKVYV